MWTLALVGAVLGQSGGVPGFDWGSILGGLLTSSPLAALLFYMWQLESRDNKELRKANEQLHDRMVDMVERFAPLVAESTRTLADSTKALDDVHDGMRHLLDRDGDGGGRTDDVLRRLEAVIRDAQRDRRRGVGS